MSSDNPYESPGTTGNAAVNLASLHGPSFERVRQGALIACWASLAFMLLHLAVPLLTKAGWRSHFEFAVRNILQAAVILWLCHGIRLLRAVPSNSQARHLLSLSLLGWIVSLLIGLVHAIEILTNARIIPTQASVIGDAGQLLGKLALLWAISRMGTFYHARVVTLAAITALLLLIVTDLPYLVADVLSVVYSHTPADLAILHAQLKLLDVTVHWMLYLLMNSAALYALYALGTFSISPQPEQQTLEPANWIQEFQQLFTASRFRWGLTLCWGALILAIIVPRCCRVMALLQTPDRLTFSSLSLWSERAGMLCQLLGMGLLWTISHERVKPWFAWGAIMLFAGASFDVMQFYNGYDMELDTPSARHVMFIAEILPIIAIWFHIRGFAELAKEWQDPPMQLRARQALWRYTFLAAIWFFDRVLLHYATIFIFTKLQEHETLLTGLSFLVHTTLEILLLLSYIPLLKITDKLALMKEEEFSRLPIAEPQIDPSNHDTSGATHESESV